jgi:iron complex outermembrane recepter protein
MSVLISTTTRVRICYFASSWLVLTAMSAPGLAATPGDAETAAPSELQEVVVTAERRESTVQATPISITAVSGEQLASQGITRLEDLATETPGISMKQFAPGLTEYEMRGLPSSGGSSATVGLYINDIPLAASANSVLSKAAIDPDLFDLQRVEVLRGPQGTLYGAGSMGGTIRLITASPNTKKFEAAGQVGTSHTQNASSVNWDASGMVNLPIKEDVLAVRFVGTDKYAPGFIDRIVVSPFPVGPTGACGWPTCTRGDVSKAPVVSKFDNYNWDRLLSGRVAVRYTPNDRLTVDLLAMSQKISAGGLPQADVSVGVSKLERYQPANVPDDYHDLVQVYSLNLNYNMDFADLTSTTAKWIHHDYWTDDDTEVQAYLINFYYGDGNFYPTTYTNSDYIQQFSQEVRLTSRSNGPLQWVGGLFYSDFESTQYGYIANPQLAYLSTGGADANPDGVAYESFLPYKLKQYAVYAEGSYKFTDALKLTVGARGFKYTAHENINTRGLFTQSGNLTPTIASTSASNSGFNPKVNLSYEPTRDLTVYAQIAKGFRPGGANQPAPVALCGTEGVLSYGPDSIWDYEVGEKARLFDGAVQINADFFYTRWNDVQQLLTLPCSYPFSDNIGKAETYGPEVELNVKPSRYVTLSLAGTHTTARFTSINPSLLGNTLGATEQLSTNLPILNVPNYTASAAIDVNYPISPGYDFTARLSETTTGRFSDIDYNVQKLPGYTLADLRLGLAHGAWKGYLYVNNLANRIAVLSIDTHSWSSPVPAYQQAVVSQPRTVGVELSTKF